MSLQGGAEAAPTLAVSLRRRAYEQLEPAERARGLSVANRLIVAAILLSALLAIVATEPLVQARFGSAIPAAEFGFGALFLTEYLVRLWVAADNARFGPGWRGRVRFAVSPGALIDLIAVVVTLAPFIAGNALALRMFRLLRILSLARLGRMSSAMRHLSEAVASRRYELLLTAVLAVAVMVLSAGALWAVEGDVQPDKFGSVPRALWWAVATLTTIGYGDVYPVTPLGKLFAGIVAIAGIGLISLPTGILAAAFSDAVQRDREDP